VVQAKGFWFQWYMFNYEVIQVCILTRIWISCLKTIEVGLFVAIVIGWRRQLSLVLV
jgi:hypothetical protein